MSVGDDRDPRLIWTEAGEPRSGRFDDVYFSAEDGLAESRAVFLEGCGLPQGWAGRDHYTIAELGFGTGLNIAAALDLWHRTRPAGARLTLFSIEAFPLTVSQARRALSRWPGIADVTEPLLAAWPPAVPGFHRVDLPGLDATLDLAVGEVDWALAQWSGGADAWFLDGFSPATNPAMWSDAVMDAIASRSAPDARIATFTVAGDVRRRLAARGFTVEKKPGHGRKRQRLEAHRAAPASTPPRPRRIAIVGAGIAGASVARALAAQGLEATVFEAARPGHGASGFPAALVTARFDLGDAAIAAVFARALDRAGALYRTVPGAVLAEGVVQTPATERDRSRFARIAEQPLWPQDALVALEDGGLAMRDALTVAPSLILSHWLAGATLRAETIASVTRGPAGWTLLGPAGDPVAEAEVVLLCAGARNADLVPGLALSPVRGQAEWIDAPGPPATAWGGYVAPTAGGFLFGATHDRGQTATAVRPEDTARNLAALSTRFPDLASRIDPDRLQARAAVRATTRDRLPICGPLPDQPGLFVLGGLGSRGFCLAPLLAEHLVAQLMDRASPLPLDVAARIGPERRAAIAEPPDVAHA